MPHVYTNYTSKLVKNSLINYSTVNTNLILHKRQLTNTLNTLSLPCLLNVLKRKGKFQSKKRFLMKRYG